jgi:hypothetical protein
LIVGLVACCTCGTARADFLPHTIDSLQTAPVVQLAYTFGGENLNRDSLAKKDSGGTTYLSGEGLAADVGMLELFGDSGFGMKQELGYWVEDPLIEHIFDSQVVSDSTLYFDHPYANALLLYHRGDAAVATGVTYHAYVRLTGTGQADNQVDTPFRNAFGWIIQYQFKCVTLRFTEIRFTTRDGKTTISGSNVGLFLTYGWY